MAKVKGMMGTKLIGKLGPAVYYMRGGQNINRELAASVSNPKTEAQMNQRTKLANLVHLYQANKAWMERFAFENKPETQTVYNAFMAANLGVSQVYLTKAQAERNMTVLAPEQFTKGSLPAISVLPYDTAEVEWPTDIVLDPNGASVEYQTVGVFSGLILANNPDWEEGDQLSIIINASLPSRLPQVYSYEITLDSSDTTPFESLAIHEVITTASVSQGSLNLAIVGDTPVVYDNTGRGILVIHSRKSANGIKVSPATMVLNFDAQELYVNSSSEIARSAARRSYGGASEPFLVPGGETEGGVVGDKAVVRLTLDGCTMTIDGTSYESGYHIINAGDNVPFTIVPKTGYQFESAVFTTDQESQVIRTTTFNKEIEQGRTYGIICVCAQSE